MKFSKCKKLRHLNSGLETFFHLVLIRVANVTDVTTQEHNPHRQQQQKLQYAASKITTTILQLQILFIIRWKKILLLTPEFNWFWEVDIEMASHHLAGLKDSMNVVEHYLKRSQLAHMGRKLREG